jgi:hypothetical protein
MDYTPMHRYPSIVSIVDACTLKRRFHEKQVEVIRREVNPTLFESTQKIAEEQSGVLKEQQGICFARAHLNFRHDSAEVTTAFRQDRVRPMGGSRASKPC